MFRLLKHVRTIFIWLFIVLAIDVFTTRYLLPDSINPILSDDQRLRTSSDIYHHDLKPNVSLSGVEWGSWRYSVNTNSLGFKDREVRDVHLLSERPRLLLIGDSFTEGVGYPFEETFAGLVSERLSLAGIDVLNAGVVSYSPAIYYKKIKHLYEDVGLRFDQVVVFLDISDIMDEAVYYRLDEAERVVDRDVISIKFEKKVRKFLERNSMSFATAFRLKRLLRPKPLAKRNPCLARLGEMGGDLAKMDAKWLAEQVGSDRGGWSVVPRVYEEWGQRGLEVGAKNMSRLAHFLAERGIPMTLVVYPWPDQIFAGDLKSLQVSHWKNWANLEGVTFINLFPDFVNETAPIDVYSQSFVPCDVHWNEDGHRLVADRFLANFPGFSGAIDGGHQ